MVGRVVEREVFKGDVGQVVLLEEGEVGEGFFWREGVDGVVLAGWRDLQTLEILGYLRGRVCWSGGHGGWLARKLKGGLRGMALL